MGTFWPRPRLVAGPALFEAFLGPGTLEIGSCPCSALQREIRVCMSDSGFPTLVVMVHAWEPRIKFGVSRRAVGCLGAALFSLSLHSSQLVPQGMLAPHPGPLSPCHLPWPLTSILTWAGCGTACPHPSGWCPAMPCSRCLPTPLPSEPQGFWNPPLTPPCWELTQPASCIHKASLPRCERGFLSLAPSSCHGPISHC